MQPRAAALLAVQLAVGTLAPACSYRDPRSPEDVSRLSERDRARHDCRTAFAACAPDARYPADLDVDHLTVRSLVQITWRLDLDDGLCERAGELLRELAERGDLGTVREIATAGETAAATLGRCRCQGDAFRPQYEKQRIGAIVAGRLPPPELREPSYWADRIDPHLVKLRDLYRRSAELVASGDAGVGAEIDAQARREERDLCEDVHAARDVLPAGGMSDLRALVFAARGRTSGEASVDAARRALEHAEQRTSCAARENDSP